MKTKKMIATAMSAVLSVTVSLPFELSGTKTNAFSVSEDVLLSAEKSADDSIIGDVNGDTVVDSNDASAILAEYSVVSTGGKATFSENQKKSADINKNGSIDSTDASLILSYYSYTSTGGTLDILSYLKEQEQPPQTTATTTKSVTTTTAKTTTTNTAVSVTTEKTTATASSTASTTASSTISATTSSTTSATTSSTTSATTSSTTSTTTSTTKSTTTASTTTAPPANKVSGIHIDQTEVYIGAGYGGLGANVKMLPETAENKDEIWTSSDESIATVNGEGWIIGKKEGNCKVTVRSADNPEVSAEISVNIVDPSTVSAIRLSRKEVSIQTGNEEYAAIVTMFPSSAQNKGEKWYSSDEKIASVNNEGWLVAKKAGTCAITVQSVDNPSIFAVIVVNVYDKLPVTTTASATAGTSATTTTTTANITVSEIKLSKYSMTVAVGGEPNISLVTMFPQDAKNQEEIWISSNEQIAVVDKFGWVKGISAGECTVTVYSVSNPEVKAEIAVKVVDSGEEMPLPDVNFSYIIGSKSDNKNLAFYTPIPKNASGRFIIDYVITDNNKKVSTATSSTILAPEMSYVITMLTADTNDFTVETYVTNLATNERAKIGTYNLSISPRNAGIVGEDIDNAFALIDAYAYT